MQKKVAAFMTCPRYVNGFARNHIDAAFRECGIPMFVSNGVFYGQCMQRMFEDAVSQGCDIGVTVDFDSMFRGRHVKQLMWRICNDESVDAVAALQCRRGEKTALATIGREANMSMGVDPIRVSTAHFGLTAIDMKKLVDLPKPWFHSEPNEDGQWADGKIDDDIWFWKQWSEAGHSVYIEPTCRIGHLEEVVTMFDENGNGVHVYPDAWAESNG